MKDFTKRSVTGIIYVVLMLAGASLHPILFAVIFGGFLILTQLEFYKLVEETAGIATGKTIGLVLGILYFFVCFGIVNDILPAKSYLFFFPALIFIFLAEVFSERPGIIQNSAVNFTGFVYVALPFSLLNFMVYPNYPANSVFDPTILIGVFFLVWSYDSMAYLAGSKFGKHKIFPRISPKKSWEGFIAGTLFTLIIGVVNSLIFSQSSLTNWLVIAALVVVFGTLGDLFESVIKRRLKVKDSGAMLPGHGGLLDRFDSLLFVIPVVYVWLTITANL